MAEEKEVQFTAEGKDAEAGEVKIHSPAKNRYRGTTVTPRDPLEARTRRVPILFERAAKSWWNPKFDSDILENGHQKLSFPQTRKRFQMALGYIIVSCFAWGLFFGLMQQEHWIPFTVGCGILLICAAIILGFSYSKMYQRFKWPTSVVLTVFLCIFCLLGFVYDDPDMSAVGTFTGSIEILLMMYTVIPLPLYLCISLGVLYSVSYELLSGFLTSMQNPYYIIGRALLHVCIHLVGIHIFITAQVRKRSTFLKVGQSIMSRQDLAFEKKLKQKMIHSLMPPTVAEEIIKTREDQDKDEDNGRRPSRRHSGAANPAKMTFRNFHMSKMEKVSILFADIVGFTKMSSNKTAEHLVSLLNDLFGRFDKLCKNCGCEKISTLGDCYYCVSGCPTERHDHARCCVEMGREMCVAIQDFDRDHKEEVNMRVGVHTGTVLCGLVGTRRFKFDVWSHDVTLANTMESEGEPGKVHISDCTYKFIQDEYEVEPGKPVKDIRMHKVLIEDYNMQTQQYIVRHIQESGTIDTWFILRPKVHDTPASPGGKEDVPSSPKPVPASPDAVNVTVDEGAEDQEPADPPTVNQPTSVNHLEPQSTLDTVPLTEPCEDPSPPDQHCPGPGDASGDGSHTPQRQDSCPADESSPDKTEPNESTSLSNNDNTCSCQQSSPTTGEQDALLLTCEHCARNSSHSEPTSSIVAPSKGGVNLSQPPGVASGDEPGNHLATIRDYNENENPPDANGMSPAVLLANRDNISASMEDVQADRGDAVGTALMEQIKQKRKQSDQQLMGCMEGDQGVHDYLYRPPINQCTLSFKSSNLETEYRDRYIQDKQEAAPTLAQPLFSAISDLFTSLIFYTLISLCCFLGFTIRIPWILFCILGFAIELVMLVSLVIDMFSVKSPLSCISKFIGWYPRHLIGALLACLPPIAVYTNFSCDMFRSVKDSDLFYCMLLVASLLHFCNFTMLSSWMKSSLATLAGLVLLFLLVIGVCSISGVGEEVINALTTLSPHLDYDATEADNVSVLINDNSTKISAIFSGDHPLSYEIILNMALLLLLIWFLNREFEINYRLSFHGDQQAAKDRIKMQQEKDQADWLLHNIIPEHVSDVLKVDSKYCKNHKDVGVIFAKVTNFDDFYDESFKGGREYLRVLNELMGDFEDLFDNPKYKDVEKIKTIGSCLMAASGLNPQTRNNNKDPNAHLYALMDFAQDLLAQLEQFNSEIFNFDFDMSIGFNFGAVTAGVIGTTKLLYDIWGDTVNISSRMYSTGMPGRIQVTEYTKEKLDDKFEFEYRGKIWVKGKGDMNTYLLVKKKDGATWD